MKVGIFGGSFNPIHVGHVALAKSIQERCGLDEVWLMVSPQNPLKQQADLLEDCQRLEMVQLAVQDVKGLKASDFEFHLSKPSYTWHTLQRLSQEYPQHTFTLIIGGDNWAHFERWYHWKDILRHYRVVAYPRDEFPGTISMPLMDVSSTDIRWRIRQGLSIDGLLPEAVAKLINERGLYVEH